jgi:hypothetical protein
MKLIPCLFLIFLVACASRIEEQDNLLQTESYTLTKADLLALSPEFESEEDSIKWVKTFLKSWKRDRSFLESAQKILESSELDFEKQIEDYKHSLIRHRYEEWIVSKYLDTLVTKEEIQSYYDQNKSSFLLLDYMVQPHFVSMDVDADKTLKREVKKLFKSKKEKDWMKLDKICYDLNADYELFDSTWYKWNDFSSSFDLKIQRTSSWLRYNNFIEFEDSMNYHLIKIQDYKLKNELSPLEFETEKVGKIILLKRKLKLIKEKKEQIYKEYLKNIKEYE